jgi:tetratricopeptide (TPR) repeat protein
VAEEELGPMLQAADRISQRQLAMAAAHADEFATSLERSLLELDILNTESLRYAIAGRLSYLLTEILDLRSGEVKIFGAHVLPTGFLPTPPLRVHVAVERGIYERFYQYLTNMPARKREIMIEGELDAYPEIVADERDRLERAITDGEQWRLVERVMSGRRRLREVFTESGLPSSKTFAVTYALHRMGLLRFDTSLHHTIVRERMRENVTVKYLSVHKASFFEVLNVHWSSYDEAIEKAYRELITQFDPATVPAKMEEEVHQRVAEIRERVEAAHKALARREDRHAYRMRIMPEYKLAHAIPLFMKQSELAERRKQWNEARDAIRRVLEIDPSHAEARRRLDHIDAMAATGA